MEGSGTRRVGGQKGRGIALPALSRTVIGLKPSETAASAALVAAMMRQGIDVVDLTMGEPDMQPPAHAQAALVDAMRGGDNKYTPASGTLALRTALVDKFRRENGVDAALENVVVTAGGKQLLFHAFLAILEPGDEVILPAPYWPSYTEQIRLAGGTPVIVETRVEDNYVLDPAAVRAAMGARTKALLINSPNNPTGALIPAGVLAELAQLARQHDLWLLSDEMYEHLVYDGTFQTAFSSAPERTLVVNGASKSYAMTGWRIGYGLGPGELISAIARLQGQSAGCINSLAQAAAAAALADIAASQDFVGQARAAYRRRRDRFVQGLNELGLPTPSPPGAFYTLSDFTSVHHDANQAARRMLQEAHVGGTPGEGFGAPGRIRFSFAAADERLELALARLSGWLQRPLS